ncbi:MAG TPA: HupE/UreJ family protein, partial [Alphaproteobacteria bacterium]|nr:HupE/UreJ family protein [Alphaproteobacteria bacterium]
DLEAKRLSKSGHDLPPTKKLGDYLAARLSARSGKAKCDMAEGPRALASTKGYTRFEFLFKCPSDKDITIHSDAFYDLVPSHTDFAQIEDSKGQFYEQLLTDNHREVNVSQANGKSELESAGFLKYIEMGIWHIFTGIDHMSFMLGLVLISRRVRDLLFVVTGFTIGHSLTLALAVTGIIRPDGQFIDALVAFTIAMIGAENIGDSTHSPLAVSLGMGGLLFLMAFMKYLGFQVTLPTMLLIGGGIFGASYLMMTGSMRDAGRIRLVMTLVFGLIHGFGFASNLLEMRLPTNKLAELLVGFNVGVEIGQLTVVLTALLFAYALVRVRLAVPRPLFTDIASAYLVGEGLYWFITRSMVWG